MSTRAHLSLAVKNVEASAAFYQKVFGQMPQKQTASYAKFDLRDPAFNFSMHAAGDHPPSRVSHLGVEVDSAQAVNAWAQRLRDAGVETAVEENTNCCYARQDKVWFKDPDGNAWEVFVVHEHLPVNAETAKAQTCCQ